MNNFAETLQNQGNFAGARPLQEHVLAEMKRQFPPQHPETLRATNNLAGTLENQGDLAAARELHEQVFVARSALLGPQHPETLQAINNLKGTALLAECKRGVS